ncbi:RICIN domain-containing protein [Paenibacillus sp. SC116]|uniref:RICIN domain-containing protein n=1 Tax=Paenibacillus sp. SC116 TaxID=2968986 RepID=UPI00215A1BCD|nr:RICIN domain-containing protein [Paenibacillus sp. SC116]MCR8842571.1 RICIN domain-containing protein [Paenibacillus sp. SC116]
MNFLSKKALSLLMVGAMSLSFWAPVSEAAVPEKNQYYNVKLKADLNKQWDNPNSSQSNNSGVNLHYAHNGDNQKYVFFPLDGGLFAIVNKSSGKATSFANWDTEQLVQQTWTGATRQQWYLRSQGNNDFEIVNQENGKVASFGSRGSEEFVDLDHANPSDPNRLFRLSAANSSITLPTLPAIGTRPIAPVYTTGNVDEQLPDTSSSAVVGATLLPFIVVQDNQASDYTKINTSPYYVLVKEEYWEKTFSAVVPAGLTYNYSFTSGVSSEDQRTLTDTLSITVGADFGFAFKAITASIRTEITKSLQTTVSSTTSKATEETVSSSVTNPSGVTTGYTGYQLVTKYTLKRADGTLVQEPWIVKNNKITIARKNPPQ